MGKAHEELKAYLVDQPGKAFAVALTCEVYDWANPVATELYIRYKVFEELSVRYDTGELTRRKLKKMKHYRFDAVFFIQPGRASLNQGECFTVGVELKSQKYDLTGDDKMGKYLGWTDFFFIGVPEELVEEALKKAEEVSKSACGNCDMVGVFDVKTGTIHKMPSRRQEVPPENRIAIMEQIIYNQVFKMTDAVNIPLQEIEVLHRMPKSLELVGPNVTTPTLPTPPTPPTPQNNDGLKTTVEHTLSDIITPPNNDELSVTNVTKNDTPPNNEVLNNSNNSELSEEERAARYAAAKARQDVRREEMEQLSERAAKLSEEARGSLMSLPLKHQQVFWAIADAGEPIQAGAVRDQLGFGANTLDRATSALLAAKLIERQGSKKFGGYVVTPLGQCGTECGTCAIALVCPQHQPV